MISQQQWLQSRKKLLQQVKSEVELRLGPQPISLRRYAKKLDREFSGRWQRCSIKSLEAAIKNASVVLGADFHAYAQSQRAHIRLLRSVAKNRRVVLALECLPFEHNDLIEQYLRDELAEADWLKKIDWEGQWGFPWEHYRPLLELAKARGFSVIGLQRSKLNNLDERDRWMAEEISKIQKAEPDGLVYVVVGEWHLAEPHLPRLLRKKISDPEKIVTVLQDSEDLYFRLAQLGREDSTECLRKPGQRFCMMVSPPWMKWQSYLMFLEQTYDRDLQEDFQEDYAIDFSDHVLAFAKIMQKDLKIKIDLAKMNVYGPSSKSSVRRMQKGLSSKDTKMFRDLLERDRSFLIPQSGLLYLSRSTINHAAALSGQFVHAQLSGRTRPLWNFPKDYLAMVWIEAVGFFFSKWINPKRKAENLENLRIQLAAADPSDLGREALLLSLELQMAIVVWLKSKRAKPSAYKPKKKFGYMESARIMGSVLGERLYQSVRRGEITQEKLKILLQLDVEQVEFKEIFWQNIISALYAGAKSI